MALEGSLADFGLADILQLIYFQKKTGILTLSGKADKIRLLFSEGTVVSTESKKRSEENRIGRILLLKGLINDKDLRIALDEQKATGKKIGDIFIAKGLVGKDDVKATLVLQVTETVVQLFSWKEGTYEFVSQPVEISKDLPITLDTQHLLMEGLRIVDEWSLIEGKITLDTVFQRSGIDLPLTPDEELILSYVDGENDVSMVVDLSGMGDFEASKMLVSLMERGIIEPADISLVTAEPRVAPSEAGARVITRYLPLAALIVALVISVLAPPLWRNATPGIVRAFIEDDSLKRLETVRTIERLRFRAEEYRYSKGSYPADLSGFGRAVDGWGRLYFYRIERDSVTIISAGPDGKVGTADDVY